MSDGGMVPDGLDDNVIAPFLYLTISTLGLLSYDPVVRQYLAAEPKSHQSIRELSRAVAAAGVRVRDSGRRLEEFEEHLHKFTPEEFWVFNLAIDIIAMFCGTPGLEPGTHAQIRSDMQSLDEYPRGHHWKSQVRKAGDGPVQFRELRGHIPTHKPRRW
jgi:hypothetical protein